MGERKLLNLMPCYLQVHWSSLINSIMKLKEKEKLCVLYDALKRIASYQTIEQLRKRSEKDWGLDFEEALEMSYENIKQEAKSAIKGMRRSIK